MKTVPCLLVALAAVSTGTAFAQNAVPGGLQPPPGLQAPAAPQNAPQNAPRFPGFTPFSIHFDGGTPAHLIQRITNETRKTLNAIIPSEYADTSLPPLHLANVTVPQLFEALEQASRKTVPYTTGTYGGGSPQQTYVSVQQTTVGFGFRTASPPREDSIWCFYVNGVPEMPAIPTQADPEETVICRFFQLAPFLEQGLTAGDITTAIETAWKMLDENSTTAPPGVSGLGQAQQKPVRATRLSKPNMKFHEDTKLLIVVGPQGRVVLIDEILSHLRVPPLDPATGLPVPTAKRPANRGPAFPAPKKAAATDGATGGRRDGAPAE